MTLIVDGRARFRAQALNALQSICPCFIYTLADNGEVLLQSPQDRKVFCTCYCKHLAGCNLMADLTGDANTVTIKRTGRGSNYSPRRRRVRWNPGATPNVRTANGRRPTPAAIVLGHELIHAHHHNKGTLANGRTNGIKNEEINTVRGENQLRAEQHPPSPQRTHYGRRKVPNPGAGDLDATDRYDCKCDKHKEDRKVADTNPKLTPSRLADRLRGIVGPGPSGIAANLEEALDLRTSLAEASPFDTILQDTLATGRAVIFETINVADETHTYFALTLDGDTARLTTNALLKQTHDLWSLHLLAGPKTVAGHLSDANAKRLDTVTHADLRNTLGGDDDALDATLDILTIVDGDDLKTAALYGAEWTQTDEDADAPENRADADIWKAMETARDLLFSHLASD